MICEVLSIVLQEEREEFIVYFFIENEKYSLRFSISKRKIYWLF